MQNQWFLDHVIHLYFDQPKVAFGVYRPEFIFMDITLADAFKRHDLPNSMRRWWPTSIAKWLPELMHNSATRLLILMMLLCCGFWQAMRKTKFWAFGYQGESDSNLKAAG